MKVAMKSVPLGCLVGAFYAVPAFAENVVEADPIIVTALKRETRLEDTPVSMSSVSGDQLEERDIRDPLGLWAIAPGLTIVDQGPSNTRIILRGIQAPGEPTVGIYYDETPVTGLVGATNDAGSSVPSLRLVDVDRVEVLRGPQGTLYGASAMTGALRVLFAKPAFEQSAHTLVSALSIKGGGTGYRAEAVVNSPLPGDKVAVRAVGYIERRPGYVDNVALGKDDVDDQDIAGARLSARFVSGDITIDASAIYQRAKGERPIWDPDVGRNEAINRIRLLNRDTQALFNVTGRWDLGSAEVTFTASYDRRRLVQVANDTSDLMNAYTGNSAVCARVTGAPCGAAQLADFNTYLDSLQPSGTYPNQLARTPSGELRIASKGTQTLDWTAGVFVSRRRTDIDNPVVVGLPDGSIPSAPEVFNERIIDDRLRQAAVYADLTWHVTERLGLSAGTRYYDYQRKAGGSQPIASPLLGTVTSPYQSFTSHETGTVSRFAFDWKAMPNILLYASASQGFRPGGVNQVVGLSEALVPYRSDKLWDYEAGVKAQFWGRRVSIQGDVFRIDWSNMQVTGSRPDGFLKFLSNAGAARAQGAELEAGFSANGWQIDANLAWLKARLTQDQVNQNVIAPGRDGDRIPYAPKITANAGVGYGWQLAGGKSAALRIDGSYVGSSYSEFRPTNIYRRKIDSYAVVNARFQIATGGGWGAAIFADNLFDDTAIISQTANAASVNQTLATSLSPRTIGVELRKDF